MGGIGVSYKHLLSFITIMARCSRTLRAGQHNKMRYKPPIGARGQKVWCRGRTWLQGGKFFERERVAGADTVVEGTKTDENSEAAVF